MSNKAGYDELEAGDLYHLSEHETAILLDALTFVAVADQHPARRWRNIVEAARKRRHSLTCEDLARVAN